MQTAAKLCRIAMWLVLIVCGFFQWCGIVGILINNGKSDDPYTVWPLMAAMLVLTAAVLWFSFAKCYRWIGVAAAGLAAAAIFACGLDIWQTFDAELVTRGGLTLGTVIWRHFSSMLTFVFMLLAAVFESRIPAPSSEEGSYAAILSQMEPTSKKK